MGSLFVYGTLAPGKPNHHHLAMVEGEWHKAVITGHLVEQGWGAEMGYPGIIPCETGDKVQGHLLSAGSLAEHWERLDKFEGEGYERVQVQAELENGTKISAFVYAVKKA